MSGRGEPGVAGVADVAGVVDDRTGGGAGRPGEAPWPQAEPGPAISFEVLTDPAGVPRARAMLQRAKARL